MNGHRHLRRARRHARLGLPLPADAKHRLAKRIVLKLTWFTTSHQMDHNIAMVKAVSAIADEVASLRAEIMSHRHNVSQALAATEASLRAEILGSDRRSDQTEADLVRLSATVAVLQLRLEAMADDIASGIDAAAPMTGESDVAEVRSLASQARR